MAVLGNAAQQLLFTTRLAAKLLSISDRQLWAHTQPRGPIPCVRIGNSVRYSPGALQAYIEKQQQADGDQMQNIESGGC